MTTDPTSVAVGGSARVIVDVKDSAGGPVPGGTTVAVAQANPGSGVNAQILGSPTITVLGKAEVSAIAAIEGAIALGATTPNGGGRARPARDPTATGQVAPPDGGGTGGFTGTPPGPGSIALLVTDGEATSASLTAARHGWLHRGVPGRSPGRHVADVHQRRSGGRERFVPGHAAGHHAVLRPLRVGLEARDVAVSELGCLGLAHSSAGPGHRNQRTRFRGETA